MFLFVRNKVNDFDHWRRVFDANLHPTQAAGFKLTHLWRSVDDPNTVFFLFEVEDRGRVEAYMSTPEAASVGLEAGVVEGDYHFLIAEEIA